MKYAIVVSLIFALLLNCAKKETTAKPLLTYIPENASLIIKIKNHAEFIKALQNNEFISELSDSKSYKNVFGKVSYLNYIQPSSESILAFTELSGTNFEFLYITKNKPDLFILDSVQNKSVETIEFANVTFEKYKVANTIFYSLKSDENIIISSSKLLLQKIDEGFTSVHSEKLQKLYQVENSSKSATVFTHLENGMPWIASYLKDESEIDISGFSDWISLDFASNPKKINLSGISIANDSTWNFIDLFANTLPTTNSVASFAPKNADAILSYTFDDYTTFRKNQSLSTKQVAPEDPYLGAVEEVGIMYVGGQKAIVLNTLDGEVIADYLQKSRKGSIEFQGSEILALNQSDFLEKRFHPLVRNFKSNFCAIIQNAFVFSESQSILKILVSSHKDGNLFQNTSAFKTLQETLAKESSILFITNSNRIQEILRNDFSADLATDIKKVNLSSYALGAQAIADKSFYHTNMVIQNIDVVNDKANTAIHFQIELDEDLITTPQFVINHLNGKKEIVVQDQKNTLYLISDQGKIVWKKQLDGIIEGRIHQVDIFKNGRLQLAFTTNNQLIVLDRNGKEVKQLTKTFEGGNLNPLAVFDYEKKKNYRFVVTQNDKTFMYNSKGNIVDGFKYKKASQPIIAAPKHLVIGNKDYLVFKLKDGSLKLLNRVGDVRTRVNEKIDFSENEVYVYKNRFTLSDKDGMLYEIDDKGKISKTNLDFSNDHGLTTTERTLATMNENIIRIKGKSVTLEMGVYTAPKIFYIHNKVYVSVTDLQNEKIYLFDSQAKPIAGFPISGTSSIDLSDLENDKRIDIVSKKDSKQVVVYKINPR